MTYYRHKNSKSNDTFIDEKNVRVGRWMDHSFEWNATVI